MSNDTTSSACRHILFITTDEGSFPEIPKRTAESGAGQQRFGFLHRMSAPFGFQLILVPPLRQLPASLWCQGCTTFEITRAAPTIDVLFCPEEEYRTSGEADVIPPMVRGDAKVNNSFTSLQAPGRDLERHRLAAIATHRADDSIGAQCRCNSERIPNADAPIGLAPSFHLERRRYGAERGCRPNVAVIRGENQNLRGCELPEGLLDLWLRTSKSCGDLRRLRDLGGIGSLSENI